MKGVCGLEWPPSQCCPSMGATGQDAEANLQDAEANLPEPRVSGLFRSKFSQK